MRRLLALLIFAVFAGPGVDASAADAAGRQAALERLLVVGHALYVAAHPDDENTAMLAYLAQGRKVRTAYLSLTRGEGGQNLIGSEQGTLLGVIRTQELLAARQIDGAEQYFTRALDFGYSKTAGETLSVWDREAVLGDMVRLIRTFRPDVVITRFPADADSGHGHHTASAILAREAFTAAGDPSRFPEQLMTLQPWSPVRLVWNSWRPREADPPSGRPATVTVDLGAWDPVLGESYTQLAARARTMHKSQGFGSAWRRGPLPNTFEHVAGTPASGDLFDGVDLTWRRIAGGDAVESHLQAALAAHHPREPHRAVPHLAAALAALPELPANPWLAVKESEIRQALAACLGLWLEAGTAAPVVHPGGAAQITVTAINRSPLPVRIAAVTLPGGVAPPGSAWDSLELNRPASRQFTVQLPPHLPLSMPHWTNSRTRSGDPARFILPEEPAFLTVSVLLEVAGVAVAYDVPVMHRFTDPVDGEVTRSVVVAPPLSVRFADQAVLFPTSAPREVTVVARAWRDGVTAQVGLDVPAGWGCEPVMHPVELAARGDESVLRFRLHPPVSPAAVVVSAVVHLPGDGAATALADETVAYPHIPRQVLFSPSAMRAIREDIRVPSLRVGYIAGAGDEVPAVLRHLGLSVTLLDDETLVQGSLDDFDTIVAGVRAYNTRPVLARAQDRLLAWVARGGTLVVQYAVARGLVTERLGPLPLSISRERVTDERADVALPRPDHPLLRHPNPITNRDFEGWVQERGLYFAGSWDDRYTPLLAMADPGEEPLHGGLLAAQHGDGMYVYSGLAFFRQVPAGVPGAVRLFLNLLAGGRSDD